MEKTLLFTIWLIFDRCVLKLSLLSIVTPSNLNSLTHLIFILSKVKDSGIFIRFLVIFIKNVQFMSNLFLLHQPNNCLMILLNFTVKSTSSAEQIINEN